MRTLSLLLVALLIFSSAGFAAQTTQSPQAVRIKAQIQKRGAGEKSKVRVTLGNGTMVKGYVSNIEETSFDVTGSKTGQATSVSYVDVQKIQGPGLSTGAKVGIGVAVGVAIAAVVIAIIFHEASNGLKNTRF
jgi:predicted extracellular nuclease